MDHQTNVATAKRRTREEIRQIVSEFATSGMPQSEFCGSRGISRSSLDRHLRKQRAQAQGSSAGNRLLAVEIRTASGSSASNLNKLSTMWARSRLRGDRRSSPPSLVSGSSGLPTTRQVMCRGQTAAFADLAVPYVSGSLGILEVTEGPRRVFSPCNAIQYDQDRPERRGVQNRQNQIMQNRFLGMPQPRGAQIGNY
jgi:hypothetical protein